MINGDEFKKALGEPDQAFIDRVHQTLSALPEKKEVKVKKVYRSVVLIAALLVVMTFALAETNGLGIKNFFGIWFGNREIIDQSALEGAQSSVAFTEAAMELADVRVNEVYYDGVTLFVVAELHSRDESTLFINQFDNDRALPMNFMGENGELMKTGLTVGEYAENNGYARCLSASISVDAEIDGGICSGEMMNIPGGIIAVMSLSGFNEPGEIPVTLTATLMTMPEEGKMERVEEARYRFTVHGMGEEVARYESVAGADYPSCGVHLDSIRVRRAPLGCYVQMIYTVEDREAFRSAKKLLVFELLDADGEQIASLYGEDVYPYNENQFIQMGTYVFAEEEITSLTARLCQNYGKQRFETNVISMRPAE